MNFTKPSSLITRGSHPDSRALSRVCLALALAAASANADISITDITARQRWPWNGLVDIDFTITGAAAGEAFASKYAYAVWVGDPWARGSPNDLPPEDALPMPRPLHFEQAGNEREQFCLNIAGLLCGSRLDLRIHPQSVERTKERPFLSTDAFEIYQEPFIRFGSEVITAPLVWAVINGRCRDPKEGPDTIGRLKARGCKVWTYNCLQFMPRHQILGYYRFYPWDAYMRGLEGFAFWTAHGPNGDDGWDSRAALIDNARMLLAEREEIVEARDQRRVDAWRLAVGRLIDAIVAPSK